MFKHKPLTLSFMIDHQTIIIGESFHYNNNKNIQIQFTIKYQNKKYLDVSMYNIVCDQNHLLHSTTTKCQYHQSSKQNNKKQTLPITHPDAAKLSPALNIASINYTPIWKLPNLENSKTTTPRNIEICKPERFSSLAQHTYRAHYDAPKIATFWSDFTTTFKLFQFSNKQITYFNIHKQWRNHTNTFLSRNNTYTRTNNLKNSKKSKKKKQYIPKSSRRIKN
jgi:hypothetical protein